MNNLSAVQIISSFLVGGIFVACSITLAERFGSTVGGVIGGLPATAAISLLCIAVTSGVDVAVASASILPVLIGFCGIFLVAYAIISRFVRPEYALALSTILWLCLSSFSFQFSTFSFATNMGILSVVFLICSVLILFYLDLPVVKGVKAPADYRIILKRSLLAGTVVAASVFAAKFGSVWGALFAGFPAGYFSTMWLTSRAHGVQFSYSLITPLFFSGVINVTFYSVALRIFYPLCGIAFGTLLSYLTSLLSCVVVFRFIRFVTAHKRVEPGVQSGPVQP